MDFITNPFFGAIAALLLSAAVRALPELKETSHPFYVWVYRFLHAVLANFDKLPSRSVRVIALLCLVAGAAMAQDYRLPWYNPTNGKYIYPQIGAGMTLSGTPTVSDPYCKLCTLSIAGGSGEANTSSSLGGGLSLLAGTPKSGVALQFKSLGSADTAVLTVGATGDLINLTILTNAANALLKLDSNGRVPLARLGTGTADNSVYLRGDGTWATPAGGGGPATAISTASSLPGACTVGDVRFNTTDGALYACTATNTWTKQLGGGDGVNAGSIKLLEAAANGNNYVAWQAASSLPGDTTYTMPAPPDTDKLLQCGTPSGGVSACQFVAPSAGDPNALDAPSTWTWLQYGQASTIDTTTDPGVLSIRQINNGEGIHGYVRSVTRPFTHYIEIVPLLTSDGKMGAVLTDGTANANKAETCGIQWPGTGSFTEASLRVVWLAQTYADHNAVAADVTRAGLFALARHGLPTVLRFRLKDDLTNVSCAVSLNGGSDYLTIWTKASGAYLTPTHVGVYSDKDYSDLIMFYVTGVK